MIDSIKIANFLVHLRQEKHVTQSEVAKALDISTKTISKWECGDGLPSIDRLKDIADYYGITVDELLNGERKEIDISMSKSTEIEEKKERQTFNLNSLFYTLSLVLNLLGVSIGFVGAGIANGVLYFVLLIAGFLTGLLFLLMPTFIGSKNDSSLISHFAIAGQIISGTILFLSIPYLFVISPNIGPTVYNVFMYLLIPLVVVIVYLIEIHFNKVKDFIDYLRNGRGFEITYMAAGLSIVFLALAWSTASSGLTVSLLCSIVLIASSIFAFFFKKYRLINSIFGIIDMPMYFILWHFLSNGYSYDLCQIMEFILVCGLSLTQLILLIISHRKEEKEIQQRTL